MRRRQSVEVSPRPHPISSPSKMAEPPAKRARRTDSSTMWDTNDRRTHSPESGSDYNRHPRRSSYAKEDTRRDSVRERDDRRYRSRSRSRDRRERKLERSRSRDRRDRDRIRDRRDRSVSRDRHYDRRGPVTKGDRFRDRSRSPYRNGTRDRTRTPPVRGPRADRRDARPRDRDGFRHTNGAAELRRRSPNRYEDEMEVDTAEADEDDIEELMRRNMGFTRFRSTKNTKVPGNDIYGVRKERKTVYRQYMNRAGGFNRPLSPTR